MTKHTPEPWHVLVDNDTAAGFDHKDQITFSCGEWVHPAPEEKANAKRIVACVNACAGINPEAVPEVLEALRVTAVALAICGEGTVRPGSAEAARAYVFAQSALAKAEEASQ